MTKRKKLIAYLTGATLTASSGMAGAVVPISELTLDETAQIDFETFDSTVNGEERTFGENRETENRSTQTDQETRLPWDVLEPALDDMTDEALNKSRATIVDAIVSAFRQVGGITRTRFLAEWTLSDSVAKRQTIAEVLAGDFYALGSAGAAAFLARDPDPNVRAAVVDIAVNRLNEDPEHYRRLLSKLSIDSHPQTRRAAQRALSHLPTLPV